VILSMMWKKPIPNVFKYCLPVSMTVRHQTARAARWIQPNTVLILTSNIGSASILDLVRDPARHAEMGEASERGPRAQLPAEFLQPPWMIEIIFHSLRADELRQNRCAAGGRLRQRLEGRQLGLS